MNDDLDHATLEAIRAEVATVERDGFVYVLVEDYAALREQLAEAQGLVIEANNSLYGSQGYFHSLNGGPYDRQHLARGIEESKEYGRKQWKRAEEAERQRDEMALICARLQEEVITACDQRDAARAGALEEAAKLTDTIAQRHWQAGVDLCNEHDRKARQLANYTSRCIDDVAATIRARAPQPAPTISPAEADDDLLYDAWLGLRVLRAVMWKAKLSAGLEATEQTLARIAEAHPEFASRAALRSIAGEKP